VDLFVILARAVAENSRGSLSPREPWGGGRVNGSGNRVGEILVLRRKLR